MRADRSRSGRCADGQARPSPVTRSLRAPECFGALFDRHTPAISRYIARRLGPNAADDLVAETFLRKAAATRAF
jgi:RNA polymerase sigma-70 factor (ECF subfamily)